jgi:hypothetical protein
MVVLMSCDHHDEAGCVPSNRSRARMLEQLQLATRFAEAFRALVLASELKLVVLAPTMLLERPGVTLDAGLLLESWRAFLLWHQLQPRGDDWSPATAGSDIRVPPEDPEAVAPAGEAAP